MLGNGVTDISVKRFVKSRVQWCERKNSSLVSFSRSQLNNKEENVIRMKSLRRFVKEIHFDETQC